ncbi:PREDICTED: calsyntenin-1 [Ceratosolen solmsi marchali]|uniref:Calsyntenin-1 n=1 Tax=Ceratosolen solmsi marchali TaxID=326594 RepID=A0AAJ6YPT4_9HYME|nr:PREDICTED: calsyntenin-1 [Ceratosolen solmsi marchali]
MLPWASIVLVGLLAAVARADLRLHPSASTEQAGPRLDLESLESGYHGLVKENETLVEVTPQIRALGAKICSFRIANKHHGEAPFDIILKESGVAELRALRVLNCEKRRNYKFDIAAVACNGAQSDNASVHITVVDVNEYAPQFLQPAYVSTVDEGRLYEEIVRVEASDRDCTPKFGDVCKYEILTGEQPFVIDNEGAIRNTEPLDYERSHNYILSVVAYDCGMKQSAPAMVTIKVNRVCSPGWRGVPERVDYAAGVEAQPLLPSARLELCDAPCALRNLRTTLSLATDHIGKGCDRDTYTVRSQRKLCGASRDSVDLLPTPGPATPWTATLSRDEGREADEIFEFDGANSAAIVPEDVLEHSLAQKFSIGVWVKHRPRPRQDPHVKEHILCAADDHKMNRHHYALFIRNCRLILLLRRDFTEGDPDMFRPAEWRWKLTQVCDDRWHHYAIQVNFPRVSLFVDGEEWHADKMNPEIIDDWPLHPAKGINTTLVVGACWQGSDNKTKHHFRGYLAGLSVLVGRNEKPDVLSCLRHCQEGIHVPSMDLLQPGTQLLTNSDLTELRIDGDNRTNVETLLRRIGYTNSRRFPTPGRRNFRLDTTIICEGREDRPLTVPSIQSYVFVLPSPRPGITVNGTGYIAREYADFRLGVAVFPDARVTAGTASRLDACAVSVYPSLNPDHETLSLPGDTLRRFHSISARVDRDGVVLSGADTPHNYQQIIRFITYTNRKPAYYLDRVFKLTCSELSGRFASNEYVQTLAVIHPKEKSTSPVPHSTHTANDIPMAKIVEPQPGHALLSPHHAELNEEYATTQLRDNIHSTAGGSHAVTIVAVCCIAFLLLMVVVGAARVRGANKRRRSAGEELAAETEMAWDDSALAITVNPMDRLTEQEASQDRRDEDMDDSASSDSEDGSFRDEDLDTSDCENDCDLGTGRRHGRSSTPDYEWDHPNV